MHDIRFIKKITLGSLDPNVPANTVQDDEQLKLLNKCLNDYPRGQIIGTDVSIGCFKIGDHQLTTQCVTYHIGFTKKPTWL